MATPEPGRYYGSPRWSGEILDCSMPMTFDTYSECSYRCLYCFAFFQKSIQSEGANYLSGRVQPVNVERVKRMFTDPSSSQFGSYITARKPMQWGGMSDPFDENERAMGVSLELLRFFREIEYPIRLCTKAAWWTEDERYMALIRGATHLNFMISIITLDPYYAKRVEVQAPSPQERLAAMARIAAAGAGGVTLRLRPYIIGLSERTMPDLVRLAAGAGATAVSTEFMCLERRASRARKRFDGLSRVLGFDVVDFYVQHSTGSGYLRLNRKLKEPYVKALEAEATKYGLRFYVSDAHFKELCSNGSCCGLPPTWNYSRGQFTEALLIAKDTGYVKWSDIAGDMAFLDVPFDKVDGFNTGSAEKRASFHGKSMIEYVRHAWNDVNAAHSPYKYFGGVLVPDGHDEAGNVIYRYVGEL